MTHFTELQRNCFDRSGSPGGKPAWRALCAVLPFRRPCRNHAYSAGFSGKVIGSRAPLASAFTPASVAAVAT